MRSAFCCLLVVVALVGCRGGTEELEDVTLDLALTPNPPYAGPAMVVVELTDVAGEAITGAKITLEGNMNHAGMVPVLAKMVEEAPGRYEATLEFTMGGDWFILVQAALSDGRSLEYKVDVPGVDAFCGTPAP
jgi:hypothetical protein